MEASSNNSNQSETNNTNNNQPTNNNAINPQNVEASNADENNVFKDRIKDRSYNPNENLARGTTPRKTGKSPSTQALDKDSSNNQNNSLPEKNNKLANSNPATGVALGNENSDSPQKTAEKKPSNNGNNSVLSKIRNRISSTAPITAMQNGLSKIGLGPKEGLSKKEDSEDADSEDKDEESDNKTTTGSTDLADKKIIIGKIQLSPITLVIGSTIIVFILLFTTLLLILDDDDDSSSMCYDNSSGSYTGSQDELEFMCKMGNPFGDDYNFEVTCPVGDTIYHKSHTHNGIDIACSTGTPIYAVQDGTVTESSYDGGRGYHVFLDHGDGFGTVYQHLSQQSNVSAGQTVTKGQQIGTCGDTGQSDGSHLHFELTTNPTSPWNNYLLAPNDYFGPQGTIIKDGIEAFKKNCGSITTTSNNFFIGDSRTRFMIDEGILNESTTVAEHSKAYDWFVNTAIDEANEKMNSNKKYNIIIWLGVNEFKKNTPRKYYNKYVELAQGQWSKHTIYVVSVGTVTKDSYKAVDEGTTPEKIAQFNAKMRRLVIDGGVKNIKYLELDFKEEPYAEEHGYDGVHYSHEQNKKIYQEIVSKVSNGGSTSSASSTPQISTDVKSYDEITVLKTISRDTGTIKTISNSGYNPQSFAYHNGYYYVQWIHPTETGQDGVIYKYDENMSQKKTSPGDLTVGHGNGLTYSTSDNKLYSVTTARVGDNKKATVIDPDRLEYVKQVDLDHGTSGIAYDRLTNRFITSSGAPNGNADSPGHLYVYDSSLSNQVGAKSIEKKRWTTAQDIAAYGGIIYVCIKSSSGSDHIDMYNEDNGNYLGSYDTKNYELESIDINDNNEIVLLYHNSDTIQFTGIQAQIISNGNETSSVSSGDQCCTTTNISTSSGNYCPNGITVTGSNAGTYDLDDYVEKVVTAENGGAHPEALKALAIAARTYAINRTNNCEDTIPNSTAAQVMAYEASEKVKSALQSVKGSVMLYNGNIFSAQYSSFWGDCNGDSCTSTFKKTPSDESATYTIPRSYVTIAHGHEYGLSQNGSNYMATEEGKTFDEILKFFYADGIEITGVSGGNSCSLGGNGTYKNGKIWDYNQANYDNPYCGGTITSHGCGPTAMAMVVSTMLNEEHDPPELAEASSVCAPDSHSYFTEAASKYGLSATTTKDHNEVMTALNRGDSLVIANVSNATVDGIDNFWTSGGHYIVLAGHDGRNVWVQDPHKGADNRGNVKGDGVYDFDKYIVPAVEYGYIIITNHS